MTDTEVLKWMLENINDMEHHAIKEHPYNFWPHDNSDPGLLFEEEKVGMTLREYVESRMKEQK